MPSSAFCFFRTLQNSLNCRLFAGMPERPHFGLSSAGGICLYSFATTGFLGTKIQLWGSGVPVPFSLPQGGHERGAEPVWY